MFVCVCVRGMFGWNCMLKLDIWLSSSFGSLPDASFVEDCIQRVRDEVLGHGWCERTCAPNFLICVDQMWLPFVFIIRSHFFKFWFSSFESPPSQGQRQGAQVQHQRRQRSLFGWPPILQQGWAASRLTLRSLVTISCIRISSLDASVAVWQAFSTNRSSIIPLFRWQNDEYRIVFARKSQS